jgi:hypothetical protein
VQAGDQGERTGDSRTAQAVLLALPGLQEFRLLVVERGQEQESVVDGDRDHQGRSGAGR